MIRSVVVFAVSLIAIAAPIATVAQQTTPGAIAGALTIVAQQVVDIEDGAVLALSPDGRWLAVSRGSRSSQEICAFAATTLTEFRCGPFTGKSIAADSVAWSADGAHFAFTENVLRYFDESDVWVFDVEAGTVTDLTDDGIAGDFLGKNPPLDVAPSWSPDGTEIVFARSVKTGETAEGDDIAETTLYRVSVAGGEPQKLLKVADARLAVPAGVRWLADGTILYSIALETDDPANGVWAVAADGGTPRRIVSAEETIFTAPVVVDVSTGGQALFRDSYLHSVSVDLKTGKTESVGLTDPAAKPIAATFSTDGTRLLILDAAAKPFGQLIVRDLATGEDRVAGTLDRPIGVEDYRGGLTWAANDLIFGASVGNTGVLVQLG